MHHSPSASLLSTEVQFPVIFARGPLSSHSDFFHFVVRASTFVYPYENEFLKVIASVLHSACCSLGEGVINGSSQSVCSRQALLLPLPPRTTHASLTPSQEQTNIWLHPASRNKNGKWWGGDGDGRMRKYQWQRPSRETAKQTGGITPRSEIFLWRWNKAKEYICTGHRGKLKRLNKERSKARLIRQTGRRSFQPSTHQRSRLFRCLVGVKGRQTDCSQWYVLGFIAEMG